MCRATAHSTYFTICRLKIIDEALERKCWILFFSIFYFCYSENSERVRENGTKCICFLAAGNLLRIHVITCTQFGSTEWTIKLFRSLHPFNGRMFYFSVNFIFFFLFLPFFCRFTTFCVSVACHPRMKNNIQVANEKQKRRSILLEKLYTQFNFVWINRCWENNITGA